jgi:SAM-dependent methyltransferase
MDSSRASLSSGQLIRGWWQDSVGEAGWLVTLIRFTRKLWEFALESTPERKRRRYGDIDYDWEHRVDTTGATVSAGDRWRGMFLSPYQATDSALFESMLSSLPIRFEDFMFIDLGSGKGRTLLMASEFPFRQIMGVEILPELHEVAEENIKKYRSDSQRCHSIQAICADAAAYAFPAEPVLLYLFNPLPAAGLARVISNLDQSLDATPRLVCVLYHNPLLEDVLESSRHLRRLDSTEQYSVWSNQARI